MHGVETLETDGSAEHAALGFESGSRVPASEVEDPCSLGLGASAHVMPLPVTHETGQPCRKAPGDSSELPRWPSVLWPCLLAMLGVYLQKPIGGPLHAL